MPDNHTPLASSTVVGLADWSQHKVMSNVVRLDLTKNSRIADTTEDTVINDIEDFMIRRVTCCTSLNASFKILSQICLCTFAYLSTVTPPILDKHSWGLICYCLWIIRTLRCTSSRFQMLPQVCLNITIREYAKC